VAAGTADHHNPGRSLGYFPYGVDYLLVRCNSTQQGEAMFVSLVGTPGNHAPK
jgi:hypothetical protein